MHTPSAVPMSIPIIVTIASIEFGSACRRTTRKLDAPFARAVRMYGSESTSIMRTRTTPDVERDEEERERDPRQDEVRGPVDRAAAGLLPRRDNGRVAVE